MARKASPATSRRAVLTRGTHAVTVRKVAPIGQYRKHDRS